MTTKRDLRKEKNREAIMEAALEIAREESWEKVTIRKIADRILYTPPIVYEHFKNKDDLLKQLVERG
ncbi:MAG: helix-turn-helix domain-containing protein [Bacteroidota bacterium]